MSGHVARQRPEPTPWGSGMAVAGLSAALIGVGMYAFLSTLATDVADWFAALVGLVSVGGAAPALWALRSARIWRWVLYGALAGTVLAGLALLATAWAGPPAGAGYN